MDNNRMQTALLKTSWIFFAVVMIAKSQNSVNITSNYCNEQPLDIPNLSSFTQLTYNCSSSNANNFTIDNNAKLRLWVEFINCTEVPADLFLNRSNVVQTLVLSASLISNPEMKTFSSGVLGHLIRVESLQLRGFESLQHIDEHALSSLLSIRCLYIEGLGKIYMSFADILSMLGDLSGTPLKSIILNNVQSARNKGKKLNLNVFAISNVTLRNLAIENSVITSLEGQLSKVQPSLELFSLSISSNYDDMLSSLLDALLFMPNLHTINIYGYPGQSVFNIDQEIFNSFLRKKIAIEILKQFYDPACHFDVIILFSKSLRKISINNIQTINFVDWLEPIDDKDLCFHESNQLIHLDFSNSGLGSLRLFSGLFQLETFNARNASMHGWNPKHLQKFPALKTLLLSDNNLGEYIQQDVEARTFRYGQRLVTLDLARCRITYIPYGEFSALTALQYLNLTGNQIQYVDWYLKNFTQLRVMNLSNNMIEKFTDNFMNNQLASLTVNYEPSHPKSASLEIDLSGNPLSCLCNASVFAYWVQSRKEIKFTEMENYECLYPNGTWQNLSTLDTDRLNDQCKVIHDDLENNTKCPCDYEKLQLLYTVRYSLAEFYCYYPDGTLIQMKTLIPLTASKVCLASFPSFVIPVVTSVAIFIIIVITVIFVIAYKHRRPEEFNKIIACLDPSRLTGVLMLLLSDVGQTAEEITINASYDAYFGYCSRDRYQLDREIISKLSSLGLKIVTEEEIALGADVHEAILEVTRKCKSIVLILTPEFVQDPWLCRLTKEAMWARCALVPLVYRPLELSDDELLFTSILKSYLPIYWPTEEAEDQDRVLRDLSERLSDDTRTRVGRLLRT